MALSVDEVQAVEQAVDEAIKDYLEGGLESGPRWLRLQLENYLSDYLAGKYGGVQSRELENLAYRLLKERVDDIANFLYGDRDQEQGRLD